MIFKSSLSSHCVNIDLVYNAFEMLACCFRIASNSIIFIVIYGPESAAPSAEYFTELIALFEILATYKSKVILKGYYNVHFNAFND